MAIGSGLPWDRLMEGSDQIAPGAGRLRAYADTKPGYAAASAHIAALREADLGYSVGPSGDPDYPFAIFVATAEIPTAEKLTAATGLSIDCI